MEWVDRMNQVIEYVESHLVETVDTDTISRIMGCTFVVFQRSFVQITDIPLSEYIRRRRLTCAAYEIQNSTTRILDIAIKYGYDSPDAFCVAFKRLHGVTPAMARQRATRLRFYTRLCFTLTIQGVCEMDYRLMEKDAFTVIGRRRTTPFGGGTWGICKQDGSLIKLQGLGGPDSPLLGLCFGFDEAGNNDYMVGIEWTGQDTPDFETYTYPASAWLVFEVNGTISEQALGKTWKRIYGEFLPQSAYQQSGLPTIEVYKQWDEKTDTCRMEIHIPVQG